MTQQASEQLARLWTESQPIVAAYILSAIPDFHQAEDVLQQVAVVLVREFERFDASRPFLPWALGIARNLALKSRRDAAKRSKYLISDAVLDQIQAAFHESEDSLLAIRKSLRFCLNKQPPKVLELLQWRYAHDLKPSEAAMRMGITSGAVRAMLHRARGAAEMHSAKFPGGGRVELNATELIDDYLDGELDEAGGERLRAWLEANPKNVQFFARHVFLHRQLREGMLAENVGKCLEASNASHIESGVISFLEESDRPTRGLLSYVPVLLALVVGIVASSIVTWQIAARWFGADGAMLVAVDGKEEALAHGAGHYVATLVNVTNCRWDQALSTADLKQGSVVRSGESLHLQEGVAEINSTLKNGGLASLQLEGPLAMTLNSQGMPSLLYGHLTGKCACDYDQFALDTPLGRVNVSGDASIGVIAAANKVELHVFTGTATLELWAMGFGGAARQLTAPAGTSLSARVDADGSVSVDHGTSKESGFMTPAALAASRLRISQEYVATILAAKPVAYWRFEGDVNGLMRNEMSNRFHCRMVGEAVRWHTGEGNSTAEFGATAGPGYLISDDVLDGVINDDYSLEAWVKPTYFHHGALISLIQWSPTESPLDRHRLHLELVGPCPGLPSSILRSAEVHPGRIRFIHQTSECYSDSPYRARAWQHIAAVRDGSKMQLYADGKVVATGKDSTELGSGLRVLMGQLFPRNPFMKDEVSARLFVGELDEVALYDRALSGKEIERHVQLARPESDSAPQDSSRELK